ncbi:unnamed protein product [Ceutorhynchus assimilis]|uniref:Small acidic protein-like domain-containing protein n=1 Tax=Ceutorhynchus assimilis TaxID=467358 RepID=A0A9P0DEI1_9CUCU|nr:unnamed protein product [Ceutorhynchus assimilis]
MNSLLNYGSDDNSDDSGKDRFPEMPGHPNQTSSKNYRKPASHEDNYEEVGMDMSEDSNSSSGPAKEASKSNYPQNRDNRSRSKSPKYKRSEDDKRNGRNKDDRFRDDRSSRRRDDDRDRRRDGENDKRDDRNRADRSRRDDDKGRDKNRDDRRDRRDDRYRRDRRDKRRSKSRDRRRSSRSPKRSSPRRNSRSPRRSRSGSKDKEYKTTGFTTRREKADKRMDRLGKLGIEFKPDNYPASAIEEAERNSKDNGNKFFMPGITGRFRDQIEKRKLLWQKAKEPESKPVVQSVATCSTSAIGGAGGSKATKVYEATTFADDRTSNKFKRLMGIKKTDTDSLPVKSTDVLKKQQEMFTSMEAQYEVARTATHTMRGVGLGFGSFQR